MVHKGRVVPVNETQRTSKRCMGVMEVMQNKPSEPLSAGGVISINLLQPQHPLTATMSENMSGNTDSPYPLKGIVDDEIHQASQRQVRLIVDFLFSSQVPSSSSAPYTIMWVRHWCGLAPDASSFLPPWFCFKLLGESPCLIRLISKPTLDDVN